MAWIRLFGIAAMLAPVACMVTVNDDPDGDAGSGGSGGSGGDAGSNGGDAGSAGTTIAGSGGSAGDGGSSAGSGGGDAGGSFPAPTCDPEPGDESDECIQCLKANCCEAWLGCDDATCLDEVVATSSCLLGSDFPNDAYEQCVADGAAPADFPQSNTLVVFECVNQETSGADAGAGLTRCGIPCWGEDVFLF